MAHIKTHSHKHLIIPDYVLLSDLPTIANYFEKYNIAKIKSVDFYEGNSTMYEDDNGDTHYYGYAKIVIDEYYNNTGSRNFYDTITNNKCKMVFDDYDYWDLEFDLSVSVDVNSEVNVDNNVKKELEVEVDNNSDIENKAYEKKEFEKQLDEEVKGEVDDEVEEEVYDDNYSFEYYNKLDNIQTRSKTKSKLILEMINLLMI
jgi:hypothetical protein